jgi:glutathione S-transferase
MRAADFAPPIYSCSPLPKTLTAYPVLATGSVMLTLYGFLRSGNVYKVRLLLAQLGTAHRRVEVSQLTADTARPEFRAINPIGKVPTLVFDDGRMLSESGAILHYLAAGTRFWPDDRWQQAQVLRWMFFEQYSHEPAIAVNRFLRVYTGSDDRTSQIESNHRRGMRALGVMDEHLRSHAWFGADRYSIADMALYAYTHVADEGGFDLAPFASVQRWLDYVRSQPGHILLMQETSAEPVVNLDGVPVSAAPPP